MSTAITSPIQTVYPDSSHLVVMNCIQMDRIFPNAEKWYYLVPVIAAVALSSLYVPNVALGLAVGTALSVTVNVAMQALTALNVLESDNNSSYLEMVQLSPLLYSLVLPVGEELVFRGVLQPLMSRAIVWIAPAAAATFLGTPLSIATGVSIVATAAIFGLIHLFNEHENAPAQAVFSTLSGIALGVVAAQFGLGASIAAHIANNTLSVSLINLSEDF